MEGTGNGQRMGGCTMFPTSHFISALSFVQLFPLVGYGGNIPFFSIA